MTIYVMRHGQTIWNKGKLIQGHSDIPLSVKGYEEAYRMAMFFKEIEFSVIGVSPLIRAKQTGSIIAKELNVPLETFYELKARGYGPWEGQDVSKIREENRALFAEMKKWPLSEVFSKPPVQGIESYEEVSSRAVKLLERYKNSPQNVLFVTHSGVISALLLKLGFPTLEVPLLSHEGHVQIRVTNKSMDIVHVEGLIDSQKLRDTSGSDNLFIF